ncbi:hypothetical protein B7G54_02235 [Burkholderia puraquae]|uniref:DUF7660 domain-containing protein n=1 Tax=Burkholderia puraquae TaxID=1904757 RepID=A0A1X1PP26_9BURK|nr:hypothetical protein [Burkholderia puraquae]ORT89009.1 hypothetical protein B7G54_02235 [Burkholderia puraquae]CAB3747661.1 hypothetical protein LMG29660_00675 [Burkholderia puraquae]
MEHKQRKLKTEMATKLRDALEQVSDERSFVEFLAHLATDWFTEAEIEATTPSSPYSRGALGWENGSIGSFLEASCAWANASTKGLKYYTPSENPWRRAADILMAGKIYE